MDNKEIKTIKEKLDKFNYGCLVDELINKNTLNKTTEFLKKYTPDELIKAEFEYVYDMIKKLNKEWYIGVISSGAHSEDFSKAYGFSIDNSNNWNNDPVMFVYECPGNNIDASRALIQFDNNYQITLDEIIKEQDPTKQNLDKLFNMLLCNKLWHVDYGKEEYYYRAKGTTINRGDFLEFDNKTYSEFLLQLILEFKLSNLYTTNLFRYEIFELGEKNGEKIEKSVNLNDILWSKIQSSANYEKLSILQEKMVVFKEELKIVKPKVIFATSNPYYCIKKYYTEAKKMNPSIEIPLIVKVPHPASRISSSDRYLNNSFRIIKALEKSGVITKEFAREKIFQAYEKIDI